MPDVSFDAEQRQCAGADPAGSSDCDPVCIDAARIYDSCGAKDCLRDLTLMFTQDGQSAVENACSVRVCKASVITSSVDVEPVAYHKGFYAVDMVFYFAVTVEVYTSSAAIPTTITGLATYGKRAVLYGGNSCAKTFSSESPITCDSPETTCMCEGESSLPRATVQISNPMALSANLHCCKRHCHESSCNSNCSALPVCVANYFGEPLVPPTSQYVSASIGIFTIIQLIRDVQILIPSYDFCVPRKECHSRTDDPCEVFSKIEFPTDSFFPPNSDVNSCNCTFEQPPFGCEHDADS